MNNQMNNIESLIPDGFIAPFIQIPRYTEWQSIIQDYEIILVVENIYLFFKCSHSLIFNKIISFLSIYN